MTAPATAHPWHTCCALCSCSGYLPDESWCTCDARPFRPGPLPVGPRPVTDADIAAASQARGLPAAVLEEQVASISRFPAAPPAPLTHDEKVDDFRARAAHMAERVMKDST